MCEGPWTVACNKPAIYVKMHGNFMNAYYPKCEDHSTLNCGVIPERFL